jgi:hypothetical protein
LAMLLGREVADGGSFPTGNGLQAPCLPPPHLCASPCQQRSLPAMFPSSSVPCQQCSLPAMFPSSSVPCQQCSLPACSLPACSLPAGSLPAVFPASSVPCQQCSLPAGSLPAGPLPAEFHRATHQPPLLHPTHRGVQVSKHTLACFCACTYAGGGGEQACA